MKSRFAENTVIIRLNALLAIDEKVDSEKIEAKYVNGVLTLNLPRKEEVKASAKEISVK